MWNNLGNKSELGLKTKGVVKYNSKLKPLVSVITVVYNAEKYLEKTLLSVIEQTYDNIEFIIIDGNSTDSTKDIILKYENFIDYALSESDYGIYDAMNKAIDLCSGELVNFMNAGDLFYSESVVESVLKEFNNNFHVLYGNISIQYDSFNRVQEARSPNELWKGMVFSHQTTFTHIKYLKQFKFDTKYKIVADLDFFIKAYINDAVFKKCDIIIASVLSGGLSDSNRFDTVYSSYLVSKKYYSSPKVKIYYSISLIDTVLRYLIKKLLSPSIIKRIIQLK